MTMDSFSNSKDEHAGRVPGVTGAHLVKSYGKRTVVNDVSIEVHHGEVVGLLGANGAGKTTTFYMLVGLERPDAGSIRIENDDVTELPMFIRARLGL